MPIEPVVIPITATDADALAAIAAVKAALLDLAAQTTTVTIGGDSKPLQADLSAVKVELADFSKDTWNAGLGVDIRNAEVAATLASLNATIAATKADVLIGANDADALAVVTTLDAYIDSLHASITVDADVNTAQVAATIASLDATIALAKAGTGAAADGAGGGGILGSALFAALWGGGDSASIITRLLSPFTALSQVFSAGFLSIGSLAGFGIEHLFITLSSVVATGIAALGGGLLLGLSSLTVGLTGAATDLAGIGQAAGDIKTVYQAMNSLNTAIATYGKGSAQAVQATQALQQAETAFSPVARAAVTAVATQLTQLTPLFDKYTGLAEKFGAQIIGSALTVVEKYIPLIGKYATENTLTIKKGLQPLFTWLVSPQGFGVFNTIEKAFQKTLPSAIAAFVQGFELFGKTMALLAPETGKFIAELDKLFTKMNTPAGFAKWSTEVNKLVGEFHTWAAFLKAVVKTVADIFGQSAGLGIAIVQTLTEDLDHLQSAIKSVSGKDALSSLFSAHKAEFLALIQDIIDVGVQITKVYLQAAPFLTKIATLFLAIANAVIKFADALPGGADFLGITLILAKLGLFKSLFVSIGAEAKTAFAAVGSAAIDLVAKLGQLVAGMIGVTTQCALLNIALGSIAVIAIAAAVYELYKHFGLLKTVIISLAAVGLVAKFFGPLSAAISSVTGLIPALVTKIGLIGSGTKAAAATVGEEDLAIEGSNEAAGASFTAMLGPIALVAAAALALKGPITNAVNNVSHAVFGTINNSAQAQQAYDTALQSTKGNAAAIANLNASFTKIASTFGFVIKESGPTIGASLMSGVTAGINSAAATAVTAAQNAMMDITNAAKDTTGSKSPSTVFAQLGSDLLAGLVQGMSDTSKVTGVLQTLGSKMIAYMKTLVPLFKSIGEQLMQGLANGILAGEAVVVQAAKTVALAVEQATKNITQTASPSKVYEQIGSDIIAGLALGIKNKANLPKIAMTSALGGVSDAASASRGTGSTVTYSPSYQLHINGATGTPQDLTTKIKQMLEQHDAQFIQKLKAGRAFGG